MQGLKVEVVFLKTIRREPMVGFKADMTGNWCLLYQGDPNAETYDARPIPFDVIEKIRFTEAKAGAVHGPETA